MDLGELLGDLLLPCGKVSGPVVKSMYGVAYACQGGAELGVFYPINKAINA